MGTEARRRGGAPKGAIANRFCPDYFRDLTRPASPSSAVGAQMADGGSSNKRRNIRVRTPFLRKLVADVRENARRLAALDAADGDGEPPDTFGTVGDEGAPDRQESQDAASLKEEAAGDRDAIATRDGESDRVSGTPGQPLPSEEVPRPDAEADNGRERSAPSRRTSRKRRAAGRPFLAENGDAPQEPRTKPYVSIAELAQLTPWTEQAIRTMISRGIFVEGKHYYHVGRRAVFKWKEVCDFIHDGLPASAEIESPVPHYRDRRKD